ncbi:MAG: alpha/beta hydrolase-fold protein [Polyangiaceae bacterium]
MIELTGPYEIVPGIPPARHVRVYVPRRTPARARPVLFMFDGQNVFDDKPSFAGGWHAHSTVERLAKNVEAPVIVGLDHGGVHRIKELSPFGGGDLERELAWIERWLLPKLRAEHALTSDARRVIVGGSSMGGLAALYATLRMPHVFGGALSMSPSLQIAGGAIFDWARHQRALAHGGVGGARLRIYLDAGAHEAGGSMLARARSMAGLLAHARGVELKFREDPKGRHNEASWRRRLLPALRFHFGTSRAPRDRKD